MMEETAQLILFLKINCYFSFGNYCFINLIVPARTYKQSKNILFSEDSIKKNMSLIFLNGMHSNLFLLS